VAPAATIMVGDSLEKDVRPALALGMHAIWVTPHTETTPELDVRHDAVRDDADRVRVVADLDAARTAILRFLADGRLV